MRIISVFAVNGEGIKIEGAGQATVSRALQYGREFARHKPVVLRGWIVQHKNAKGEYDDNDKSTKKFVTVNLRSDNNLSGRTSAR